MTLDEARAASRANMRKMIGMTGAGVEADDPRPKDGKALSMFSMLRALKANPVRREIPL